jgi:uncharacterized protein
VRFPNSGSYSPKDGLGVTIGLRKLLDGLAVVKNLRVTDIAIEFDIYVKDETAKQDSVKKCEAEFGKLLNERDLQEPNRGDNYPTQYQSKEQTVQAAIDLFNTQRYWECHETLEQIWRREPKGREKEVQQGVILAASALVHHQKHEDDICLGMLPRAVSKLDVWKDTMYYGLNVSKLKEELRKMISTRVINTFEI